MTKAKVKITKAKAEAVARDVLAAVTLVLINHEVQDRVSVGQLFR